MILILKYVNLILMRLMLVKALNKVNDVVFVNQSQLVLNPTSAGTFLTQNLITSKFYCINKCMSDQDCDFVSFQNQLSTSNDQLNCNLYKTNQAFIPKQINGVNTFIKRNFENVCPITSIYEPVDIDDDVMISRSIYKLNQILLCDGEQKTVKCPAGKTIRIHSAYYGIQPSTMSKTCITTTNYPTYCYFDDAIDIIKTTCENKNQCTIKALTSIFKDPCTNYGQQLVAQYQCFDTTTYSQMSQCPLNQTTNKLCPTTSDSSIITKISRDTSPYSLVLTCPTDKVIEIYCAFYGSDTFSKYYCDADDAASFPICYINATKKLSTKCNGLNICDSSGAYHNFFGFIDPCRGRCKVLKAQWRCV